MSTCNNNGRRAVISVTLAAGSTASPYTFRANITQRLCKKTCLTDTPVFQPRFTLLGYAQAGAGQYSARVHVEGTIVYNPCGTDGCCAQQMIVSQDFTIPFVSATAPTSVTLSQGDAFNAMAANGCERCGRTFVSETFLTLTVA